MANWLAILHRLKGKDSLRMAAAKLDIHPAYLSRLLREQRRITPRVKLAMVRVDPKLLAFYLQEALWNGNAELEIANILPDSPPSAPEGGQEAVLRKEDT